MLKQRLRAAQLVAADFLRAETAVDAAATQAAACVATMLAQRAEANLPVSTGLEALQVLSEAGADLVRARRRFVEAHALLRDVRSGIGLTAYGDESECPPDQFGSPMTATKHRLAAVG